MGENDDRDDVGQKRVAKLQTELEGLMERFILPFCCQREVDGRATLMPWSVCDDLNISEDLPDGVYIFSRMVHRARIRSIPHRFVIPK